MKHKETGAFAIETVLVLTFFMLSIISIMFMAMIIKVQANMQYAISQTAKEISGYYYMIDKIGLASVMSGEASGDTEEKINDLNETIENFTSLVSDTEGVAGAIEDADSVDDLVAIAEDGDALKDKAFALGNTLIEDLKGGEAIPQLKAVLTLFGRSMVSRSFSYYVAPYICKALVPKYLTSGDAEDYCNAAGLKWNQSYTDESSTEFMDFSGSQFLLDGRSIKVDVVYTLNTKNLTFGLVNTTLTFHQCASTAAWIKPNGESLKTLAELASNDDEEFVGPRTYEDWKENPLAEEGEGE